MNKKFFLGIVFIFITCVMVSSKPGDTKYVNSQEAQLKKSTDFFSKNLGSISFGEELLVLSEEKDWSQIQMISDLAVIGWTKSANLTSRKVAGIAGISGREIALAGKGFTEADSSIDYTDGILNTKAVDRFETTSYTSKSLKQFISDGNLKQNKTKSTNKKISANQQKAEYDSGRMVAAAILSVYTEQTAKEAKEYLTLIVQTLVQASGEPPLYKDYSVGILDTDEINALSTSGGHILVSRGLLRCCSTEDELAAILAHEIGHIQLRHSVSIVNKDKERTNMQTKADSLLTEAFGSEILDKADWSYEIRDTVNNLAINGYAQDQEFEADKYAVKLLKAAGYNESAIIPMLEMLDNNTKSSIYEYPQSGFSKTHPSPKDRLKNINKVVSSKKIKSNKVRDNRFTKTITKIF